MEACYINTAHPDFLSGHQAIAIVNEQLQAKKQPAQITDKQHINTNNNNARQQQLSALQTNNTSSASSYDSNNDTNGSFFGSFFAGPKKTKKTVGGSMEAVSFFFWKWYIVCQLSYIFDILATCYFKSNGGFVRA